MRQRKRKEERERDGERATNVHKQQRTTHIFPFPRLHTLAQHKLKKNQQEKFIMLVRVRKKMRENSREREREKKL